MYEELGETTLRSGETVQTGMVVAPDLEWAERIEGLLAHKGEPWNWQVSQALRSKLAIEVRFCVLHRHGRPISNVMTAELAGVGVLGHVWTNREDRRKGAMSRLMTLQMDDFRARGGKALFLGTEFGSAPHQIYGRFGFRSVEDRSGCMEYYAASQEEFEAAYFAKGEADIGVLDWSHWPSSPALFMGGFPGVVRCAPLKLFGRASTEGPLLSLLRDETRRREEGKELRSVALQSKGSGAVVGLAVWGHDPLWPDTCVVDVYCHPDYWDRGCDLLSALSLRTADRHVAYGDRTCGAKIEVLRAAGFRETGTSSNRLAADAARTGFVDVITFERP
jgi:hypothetical protein